MSLVPRELSRRAIPAPVVTPGQSMVDEIGSALGITYRPDEELRLGEKEQQRDLHRWELDPASAEDYAERSSHRRRYRLRKRPDPFLGRS